MGCVARWVLVCEGGGTGLLAALVPKAAWLRVVALVGGAVVLAGERRRVADVEGV